ncbi:zinc ribbon domain-containing protein [Fulvivirgaceae bacterium BMA10]|uniref:Zinc ribbon domain-containing protein n=1 Tax=Splendidivirga corallicola TaxID=3051826 RepID=A0ABT8KGF8_9BACT|nr:zinc ribbon domain-containing protein [Fulvivirgaceae bacterium BMA10]
MKILINKFGYIKIALIAVVVILVNWSIYRLEPGVAGARKRQANYAPRYIEQLINKNQRSLDSMAAEIATHSDREHIDLTALYSKHKTKDQVQDVIPELLQEDREVQAYKAYIWLSDSVQNFAAGTPPQTFSFLNEFYGKHKTLIENDKFYANQDEFLLTFVDISDDLDFSRTISNSGRPSQWRFYQTNESIYEQRQKGIFILSSNVTNSEGQKIGQLTMKLDDADNYYLIYTDRGEELHKNHQRYMWFINVFCVLVIWYLLPSWVYSDAKRRGVRKPMFWAFMALISHFFGLAIYLIARPKTTVSDGCPRCNKNLPPYSEYCPHCGFQVADQKCPGCHKSVEEDWAFCSACGTNLKRQVDE